MATRQDPPTAGFGPVNDRRVFVRHALYPPRFLWVSLYPHSWRGEVLDLSASGLCFRSPLPFQSGWLLSLELLGPHEERAETLLAEVVHAEAEEADRYRIGAAFVFPLAAEQLERFLIGSQVA